MTWMDRLGSAASGNASAGSGKGRGTGRGAQVDKEKSDKDKNLDVLMDAASVQSAGSTEAHHEKSRKKRRQTETREVGRGGKDEDAAFGPLAKLVLKLSLEMRGVQAQLQDTFVLQTSSELALKGAEVGRKYSEQVEAQGRGHGLGSPHLYVTMAVFQVLSAAHPLLHKCSVLFEAESKNIYKVVAVMKFKQAYDESRTILKVGYAMHSSLQLPGEEASGPMLVAGIRAALGDAIVAKAGGEHLLGTAPRAELERVVQGKLGKKR